MLYSESTISAKGLHILIELKSNLSARVQCPADSKVTCARQTAKSNQQQEPQLGQPKPKRRKKPKDLIKLKSRRS